VNFSIITPSFRSGPWLKLCIASVADQQDVTLEHIVQDSCSDDGTSEWLPQDQRVKAFIEKDGGMYDAVNRGYRRATGDILAYLNCDEQYLPGALATVADFFKTHPEVEVVFGGAIVVGNDGHYICHRPPIIPHPLGIWFRFQVLTSSIFVRHSVVQERGLWFDTRWRALGDLHWVASLVKHGVKMAIVPGYQSCFAETGDNLGLSPSAIREHEETMKMLPGWVRALRPFWVGHHHLRRLCAGHLNLRSSSHEIYTRQNPGQRTSFQVNAPTTRWRSRS